MLCGSRIIDTNVMSLGLPQKKSSLYCPFCAYRARSYRALRHSHRSLPSCCIVPIVPYRSTCALSFLSFLSCFIVPFLKPFLRSMVRNTMVFRHPSRRLSLQMATFCRASHVLPGWRWLSHFGLLNTQHIIWLDLHL